MNEAEVQILVDDIIGVHINKEGVDIHIVELVDPIRSCDKRQIFLEFNASIDSSDVLISKLMDSDLMDSLMKQMATYRIKDTDTYFIFPGIQYMATDKKNIFKCRMMLMSPTEEEPIEDEWTFVEKAVNSPVVEKSE